MKNSIIVVILGGLFFTMGSHWGQAYTFYTFSLSPIDSNDNKQIAAVTIVLYACPPIYLVYSGYFCPANIPTSSYFGKEDARR
jgi:hypothetical protein